MKPIRDEDRTVVNIYDGEYTDYVLDGEDCAGQSYIQLDNSLPPGAGFTILRMEPGAVTTPHEHTCNEMFLMLEGELIDHDDVIYRRGDFIMLKKGTIHNSRTVDGCLIAVYVDTLEKNLPKSQRPT